MAVHILGLVLLLVLSGCFYDRSSGPCVPKTEARVLNKDYGFSYQNKVCPRQESFLGLEDDYEVVTRSHRLVHFQTQKWTNITSEKSNIWQKCAQTWCTEGGQNLKVWDLLGRYSISITLPGGSYAAGVIRDSLFYAISDRTDSGTQIVERSWGVDTLLALYPAKSDTLWIYGIYGRKLRIPWGTKLTEVLQTKNWVLSSAVALSASQYALLVTDRSDSVARGHLICMDSLGEMHQFSSPAMDSLAGCQRSESFDNQRQAHEWSLSCGSARSALVSVDCAKGTLQTQFWSSDSLERYNRSIYWRWQDSVFVSPDGQTRLAPPSL